MVIKYCIGAVILLISYISYSQVYRYPIKKAGQVDLELISGINFPFLSSKDEIKSSVSITGLGGVAVSYFYTEYLSVETGISWIRKGGTYSENIIDNTSGIETTNQVERKFDYLNIPAILKFYIHENFKVVDYYLISGLTFGFLTDKSSKIENNSMVEKMDQKIKNHDIGLNFGFGADYRLVSLDLNYNFGLTNLTTTNFETGLNNHGLQLSFVYTFARF